VKIKQIGITSNCLTSRGCTAPFANFVTGTGVCHELAEVLKELRKSKQG